MEVLRLTRHTLFQVFRYFSVSRFEGVVSSGRSGWVWFPKWTYKRRVESSIDSKNRRLTRSSQARWWENPRSKTFFICSCTTSAPSDTLHPQRNRSTISDLIRSTLRIIPVLVTNLLSHDTRRRVSLTTDPRSVRELRFFWRFFKYSLMFLLIP